MAIQNYIGWAPNVNKIILDSTTISVGKDATKKSEAGTGKKPTVLKGSFVPTEYAVEMDFNWVEIVEGTGKTEYQLFLEWYEYDHKYGTVPFAFPKILYSQNTGIKVIDEENKSFDFEYYKITSAIEGQKSGFDIRVKMTWQNVYSGVVVIPDATPEITGISRVNKNFIDVSFSSIGRTEPNASEFTLYINDEETSLVGFLYSTKVARLFFPTLQSGTYTITFTYLSGSYGVGKGDFVTGVEV